VRLSVDPSTSPDDYDFTHRIRVRFVETDAMGIVHHSNYLAYFEEARVEYLRAIGHPGWAKVTGKIGLDTVALDQAIDLLPFDLMKIDIQGGENLVFAGAERVLGTAVAVIVELRYLRMYEGEPMLGGVDSELRRQGFYLHKFMFNKSKMLVHSQADRVKTKRMQDQLLDGDGIYLRNIAEPDKLSNDQLKHLALLAAAVFDSHSLALYCVDALAARGAVAADLASRYVDTLPAELRNGA